jgi:hypothetical protein
MGGTADGFVDHLKAIVSIFSHQYDSVLCLPVQMDCKKFASSLSISLQPSKWFVLLRLDQM